MGIIKLIKNKFNEYKERKDNALIMNYDTVYHNSEEWKKDRAIAELKMENARLNDILNNKNKPFNNPFMEG